LCLKNYKLNAMDQKVVGNVIGSAEKERNSNDSSGSGWRFWKR
jgi:hypothetical protein